MLFMEALMKKAHQDGLFDDLPGKGKPLPDLGEGTAVDVWLERKCADEGLSLPTVPSLSIRKDLRDTMARIETMVDEDLVREELVALNKRIGKTNATQMRGPSSNVVPLNIDKVVGRWRSDQG